MPPLKFTAFSSNVELPFYTSLASLKINHDKLDDSARRVVGVYEIRLSDDARGSCLLQVQGNALTQDDVPNSFYRAEGMIKNVNTIEDYKALDKAAVLNQTGNTIWDAILDGSIFSCPSLLVSFCIICFADLKKYRFTYLFGFPALHTSANWEIRDSQDEGIEARGSDRPSGLRLSVEETASLVDCVQTWKYSVDARQHGFFLAKRVRSHQRTPERAEQAGDDASTPLVSPTDTLGLHWSIAAIETYEHGFFDSASPDDCFICFADPSTSPNYPAWMLRNLLLLIEARWNMSRAQILCYRDTQPRRNEPRSLILRLSRSEDSATTRIPPIANPTRTSTPKVTGWERNHIGKFASKVANLGEYMDPQRLADQAVDLNLKLIKWRIAPKLDLDIVKQTSCLLLGAGTLGSYVARNLMGWGVRKLTFVDNGSVSFSNPVRQPLFNFKDCLAGGAKKAMRAAEAVKEIYPGVDAAGYDLSVPMAGHPIIDPMKVKGEFETLESLIRGHDIIFLLMDTRESRWLPTLIGRSAGKLVMNAALGFDSFVVMRHGARNEAQSGDELGCYFCNDIVAPADSLADRTLDQQCTVTRPGVAAIASALLVEIAVSVLQHQDRALAPAPNPRETEKSDHPLGLVPHQIRGYLSDFRNIVTYGQRYKHCSACSDGIVNAYANGGWAFIERALNEKGYVEEISGLADVQRAAEKAMAEFEVDAFSEEENLDGEGELV